MLEKEVMTMKAIKTFEQEAKRIFKKPEIKKLAIKLVRAIDNKGITEIIDEYISDGLEGEDDGDAK